MGWISLAVLAESPKPLKDMSPPLLTVKMTGTAKPYSYREWLQETYRLRQYGMTLPRYGEPTFQGSILSTEDSPAKTLAWQDAERAWTQSAAAYSLRSFGLSAKYDPDSSSWKTFQRLLFEEQNESLASFAAYGMTLDGGFYPLKTWARITDVNDGGFWPTPTVNMVSGGPNHESPTVVAGKHGINLKGAVMKWPTPRAGKTSSENQAVWEKRQANGKVATPTLALAVKMYPTPRACDADKNIRTPEGRAKERLRRKNDEDLPTVCGGQLNPTWVEWLMGYPCGWTVLEDWAMQSCLFKRGRPLKD